ncbi:MAG: DoxX family protein [Pseudonocardia sp.]|nr:DoxX family protein [Pseudonocardia sp.]
MDVALWIIAGALALAFGTGGATQILLTKQRYGALAGSQQWVEDFGPGHIKAIGTIKLLGVVGLIVPPLVGVAVVLSPLAACGLMLVMAGAATTRFRRSEWALMGGDVAYLAAFAFLAWGRFALAPFGA